MECLAEAAYHQYLDWADIVYRQQIDDILAPSLQWNNFKMRNSHNFIRAERTVSKTWVACGNAYELGWKHFNDRELVQKHGPITKVVLNCAAWIDGFEIFYERVSSGLRGATGGERHDIDLQPHEAIMRVVGSFGTIEDPNLRCIDFSASLNKSLKGGEGAAKPDWQVGLAGDGPPASREEQRLQYVYGSHRYTDEDQGRNRHGKILRLGLLFRSYDLSTTQGSQPS